MVKLTPSQIDRASNLGVSAAQIQFIIDTQTQSLFAEAVKRMRHMPFDLFNAAIETDCPNFAVVRYLGEIACSNYVHTSSEGNYDTLISGETMYVGSESIIVRNKPWPRINMPLYLDMGKNSLHYVYPIFDWSEAQILAFSFSRNLQELS